MSKLYSDESALRDLLETLYIQSLHYVDVMKSEAQKKEQQRSEEE